MVNLLFFADWADYEENGWIIICEKDGQYFYQEGGHCVMVGWQPFKLCLEPISEEEVLELMEDWAEHEDDSLSLEEALRLLGCKKDIDEELLAEKA
jgi:hypothetical protein